MDYLDHCPDCKVGWDDADHMGCDVIDYSEGWAKELADGYRNLKIVHPRCGTKAGHDDHRRKYKDEFCEPCMEAMRQYWRDHKAKPEVKARYNEYNRTRRKIRNGSRFRKYSKDYDIKRDFFSVNTVLDTYGTDCHLCGEPVDLNAPRLAGRPGWERSLHIDHVIPISKGGDDTLENVRPSHGKCNIRKHNKID